MNVSTIRKSQPVPEEFPMSTVTLPLQNPQSTPRGPSFLCSPYPRWGLAAVTFLLLTVLAAPPVKGQGGGPTLWTAAAHKNHLVLIYSKKLFRWSRTPASAYTVKVNNVVRRVTAVSISVRAVTLTLASAVQPTDQVTVSYTVGKHPIKDWSYDWSDGRNHAAALTDHPVTTAAPHVSSVQITSVPTARHTYSGGEAITLEVTFSEAVTVEGTLRLWLSFGRKDNYPERLAAEYVSGSGTTVLRFDYTVAEGLEPLLGRLLYFFGYDVQIGDVDPDGLSIEADALQMNIDPAKDALWTIRDSDGHDAILIFDELKQAGNHKVDGVWPGLPADDPPVVNAKTLTVRYDEALDENSEPAPGAFTVLVGVSEEERTHADGRITKEIVGGTPNPVTDVAIDDRTVTLTLRDPVGADDKVGLRYTAPEVAPIQDLVGNQTPDISQPRLVENNTPKPQVESTDWTVVYASLISDIQGYAGETYRKTAPVERWNRVLAALGVGTHANPMTAAEAQTYADKGWKRWKPVVEALKAIEAAQSPWAAVYASLISDIQGYAGETYRKTAPVERWNRVLAALGVGTHANPMTAAEAQTYADKGWKRWKPVVEALKAIEAAQSPDPDPVVATPEMSLAGGSGITVIDQDKITNRQPESVTADDEPQDTSEPPATNVESGPPTVAVPNVRAQEGDPLDFVITLSHAHTSPVDVYYNTLGSSATTDEDFAFEGDLVTFAPGETVKTVRVATHADGEAEGEELMIFELTLIEGAATDYLAALGTITDE